MNRPIALLTDFGMKDHYGGSLKGVILGINPKATIFDITHEIRPQNIRDGAFVLYSVYPALPKGTIIVAVVDPGVGSMRQALCIQTSRGYLIGPNNGLFSLVLRMEDKFEARAIVNDRFFRKPVSSTFHGRDFFAPSAAWLSKRNVFQSFGPRIHKPHSFHIAKAIRADHAVKGEIVYIDRFGNGMTNISKTQFPSLGKTKETAVLVKGKQHASLKTFFSAGSRGALIALWNSSNLLELAVRDDSAEKLFGLKVGDSVAVRLSH